MLRSFGIETAWDVKEGEILQVPDFGEVLAQRLLSWRKSIENKFEFNPYTPPTDPAKVAKVRQEIAKRRIRY